MSRFRQGFVRMRPAGWSVAVTVIALALLAFRWSLVAEHGPNNVYAEKVLVANRAGLAEGALIDPHLINPWGIGLRPPGAAGHIWISNAGNLSSSLFIGDVHGV